MNNITHKPSAKRLWRYTGKCGMTGCDLQARWKVRDGTGRFHFLCPGHKDASMAALAPWT
jgi:hypothetical protein